jgi:hypothetical protein
LFIFFPELKQQMLEATLPNGAVLKKLIDVVKDMVAEANWECSETGK